MTEEIKDMLSSSDIEIAQLGYSIAKERKYGLLEIRECLNKNFFIDVKEDVLIQKPYFRNVGGLFVQDPTKLLKLVPRW